MRGVSVPAYLDMALDADFAGAAEGGSALRDELSAFAARMGWAQVKRLLELGVPGAFLAQLTGAGDVAAARVSLANRGAYFEVPGPDARLLLAVRDGFGTLVDLVAFSTSDPDDWALRCGLGAMLGTWTLEEAQRRVCAHGYAQLRIFATPLAWLLGGGEGVCVLDWNAGLAELRLLGETVTLRCDRGVGERLEALLRRGGVPRVKEVAPAIERRAA